MKILLLEGKNLAQTFDRYRNKLEKVMSVQNYNVNTPEELFLKLVKLDPTYSNSPDISGDYILWILNQFLDSEFDEDGQLLNSINSSHYGDSITEVLRDFTWKKHMLSNHDINSYRTVDDLINNLLDLKMTPSQRSKYLRKQIKDIDLVFEDRLWSVYIPKTYSASCALGSGSGWCTASTKTSSYYYQYLQQGGNYYVLINNVTGNKYQFHFESQQYFAAGTNDDVNTPNSEKRLTYQQVTDILDSDNKLKQFFIDEGYYLDKNTSPEDAILRYYQNNVTGYTISSKFSIGILRDFLNDASHNSQETYIDAAREVFDLYEFTEERLQKLFTIKTTVSDDNMFAFVVKTLQAVKPTNNYLFDTMIEAIRNIVDSTTNTKYSTMEHQHQMLRNLVESLITICSSDECMNDFLSAYFNSSYARFNEVDASYTFSKDVDRFYIDSGLSHSAPLVVNENNVQTWIQDCRDSLIMDTYPSLDYMTASDLILLVGLASSLFHCKTQYILNKHDYGIVGMFGKLLLSRTEYQKKLIDLLE